MKNFSLTFMIACFLFSIIFIAVGCATQPTIADSPVAHAVEEKKAAEIKPETKEAPAGRTYEEITAFRRFFLERR